MDLAAKKKTFPNQVLSKQVKLKNDNLPTHRETGMSIETNNLRNSKKPDLNKSVIEDIVKEREDQELD